MMKIFKYKINPDRLGITASVLCAIHCAALPLVITILPIWGLGFLANEWVEISMIFFSLFIGIWSLSASFKKTHHKILPIAILISGFGMIILGHFLGIDALEPILIPLGGFTIATAHFINIRFLKSCGVGHRHQIK